MLRLIYLSAALLIISFIAVPVYNGITKKHDEITKIASVEAPDNSSLSFEEIYETASQGGIDPVSLNEITPAAGIDTASDSFSTGFRRQEDSALQDTPKEVITEEIENSF